MFSQFTVGAGQKVWSHVKYTACEYNPNTQFCSHPWFVFSSCVALQSLVLKLLHPHSWLLQQTTSLPAPPPSRCVLENGKPLKMVCWDRFLGQWWRLKGDEKATAFCWAVKSCPRDYTEYWTLIMLGPQMSLQNMKSFGWTAVNIFRRTDRLRLFAL